MLLKMCDASIPVKPPGFQVSVFYLGYPGATPHVATAEEWDLYAYKLRIPAFTPSWFHSGVWTPSSDAYACIQALKALGVPPGVTVALDFETQVNPWYVLSFNDYLLQAGYKTMIYGSSSTLFKNPKPSGGYWVANYNDGPVLMAGSVATQYTDKSLNNAYDSSVIDSSVPMWGSPIGNETDMIMQQIVPAAPVNTGIWLLSGSLYVHIDDPATVLAYQSANIPLVNVDIGMHNNILAAIATGAEGGTPASTVSGTFTGTVS